MQRLGKNKGQVGYSTAFLNSDWLQFLWHSINLHVIFLSSLMFFLSTLIPKESHQLSAHKLGYSRYHLRSVYNPESFLQTPFHLPPGRGVWRSVMQIRDRRSRRVDRVSFCDRHSDCNRH